MATMGLWWIVDRRHQPEEGVQRRPGVDLISRVPQKREATEYTARSSLGKPLSPLEWRPAVSVEKSRAKSINLRNLELRPVSLSEMRPN